MKLHTLLVSLALFIPSISMAASPPDEIRYSFVDIGLTGGQIDVGAEDVDFGSVSVLGSWGVHENIALFSAIRGGQIQTTDLGFSSDVDTATVSFGVAPHFPLGNKVDLIIPVAYVDAELDDGFNTLDDSGYSLGIGIRALLNPSWELSAGVSYIDLFDDDATTVGGSIRWHIVKLFSLSAGASASSDSTAVTLGGRFTF